MGLRKTDAYAALAAVRETLPSLALSGVVSGVAALQVRRVTPGVHDDLPSAGESTCVTDRVPANRSTRFYRIVELETAPGPEPFALQPASSWETDCGESSGGCCEPSLNPFEVSFLDVSAGGGLGVKLESISTSFFCFCCSCTRRTKSFPLGRMLNSTDFNLDGWFQAARGPGSRQLKGMGMEDRQGAVDPRDQFPPFSPPDSDAMMTGPARRIGQVAEWNLQFCRVRAGAAVALTWPGLENIVPACQPTAERPPSRSFWNSFRGRRYA